jgi:UPF0755 protein
VKKLLALILALLLLGVAIAMAWLSRRPYRRYTGSVLVTIPAGAGARSAAETLDSHGVLRYRLPFLAIYILGRRHRRTLNAGEYLFDRPISARDVYWKLVRGDIYYHLVVIPEGSDRFDMARILHDKLALDPENFLRATEDTAMIADLDPTALTLEGYLFPDSYRFPASTTAAGAVQTMVGRFRRVLSSHFLQDLNGQNLHQVVTLASLVEKETPDPAERPEIAGVFERRLQLGMLLDCDPTVIYAARLESGPGSVIAPVPGPLTVSQLNSASPYNTYRHPGLPPGPICSPGAASIEAALHPASGDTLYFVSNLHGGHVFSRTLEEHNRNVARYRRQAAELRN